MSSAGPFSDPGTYVQRKLQLFTDPTAFFEESLKYPYMWKSGLLVLLSGFAFLAQGLAPWGRMPLEVSSELTFGLVMLSFVYFFAPVMLWFSAAVIWRVLVLLVGGNAKFYNLLKIGGYGFPTFIVTGIAWALGRWFALGDEQYEFMEGQVFRIQDELFELTATQEFASKALTEPVFQLAFLVGLLFTVFAVYIWTYGLSVAADISLPRAAALAVVPYAIFVWWVLQPVFL